MKNPSQKRRETLRLVAEGRFYPDLVREDDGWHARWRAVGPENPGVDECVRSAVITPLSEDAEEQKHETLHDAWMMALRSRTGLVRWADAECERFAAELAGWHGGADDPAARAAICFSLEIDGGIFRLSCAVPKGRGGLRVLGQAAYVFGPLRTLRAAGGGRLSTDLPKGEAEAFLRTGARELRAAGYAVSGDDLLAPIAVEAEVRSPADVGAAEANQPSACTAELKVRVAGEVVSANEIRFLLDQGSSLVFFRDRWIEVDRGILREALRVLERNAGRKLTRMEAVSFAMGVGSIGRLAVADVRVRGGLRGLLNELKAAGRTDLLSFAYPGGFTGELRDYQKRGAAWLAFLTDHGFGALLADDMGLGKTSQTIAWMLRDAAKEPAPYLVVAPLTLLSNWVHEFAKFAPGFRVYVHQGDARHVGSGFRRAALAADVVITSYSLLVKDYRSFGEMAWKGMVLDEAQTIKNPATQVARAVCALRPARRIALTGTPVENSVADVWSIEQFLNPGLLGDRAEFTERFVKPLAADPLSGVGRRLARALEPFVLRRLKSDPVVAAELGDKREVREYCALAPAERAAYETALADFRTSDRRQGDIFALLTRLKLVCDGLVDSSVLNPKPELVAGGGKLQRLVALLECIFDAGESALVFTQYAKVGAALRAVLEAHFGRGIPFLHGGLSAHGREGEIAAFNRAAAPTAFVLSLKAGGFGLNLTRATHVIHYDRWWNPAVEDQATDRAHRLGQSKDVFVHLFIASGTLEEHVDEILERKSALAGTLVTSGESFLARMGASDFERTVRLDE